ncbi:hypothetical protein V2J09_019978 [Rumex salicifolius]
MKAYSVMKSPVGQNYLAGSFFFNTTKPLEWVRSSSLSDDVHNPQNATQVISADDLTFNLFVPRNMTKEEKHSLLTWNHLKHLINQPIALPNAIDATREAANAWSSLMNSVESESIGGNHSLSRKPKTKQCPPFLDKINATRHSDNSYRLPIPCGLTQGSSITFIGIPHGVLGNFKIELTGEHIPGEPEPPVILHYNVRLRGDKVTEDPVIVQNTWTVAHDWDAEERCPSSAPEKNKKVDELDQCSEMVGRNTNLTWRGGSPINGSKGPSLLHQTKQYFPFRIGYPFVATLRVGSEGMQMTVDGKHITSFAFRENLEPWLVNEARISGELQLKSILASSLPTSEDLEHVIDLEALKSPPLPKHKDLDLLVGVFSTANNFKRRMAVRRTWMQYPLVRSGDVAVRFFVGLHKSQRVNVELWNEAKAYGDVQLMPFVDYYSLITWKTLAICIFGTNVVSAKYIMKTDDDAFVRVDEVLNSLHKVNVKSGLLYGLINSDSQPHRNTDSKWYISPEEWPEDKYPPWAHGPGYVVSYDIAKKVSKRHKEGRLKMFKLEDVAMGIWIDSMKKEGLQVRYERDKRVYNEGCKDGYLVAHYQGPSQMLCLWQKLKEAKNAICCGD